MKILKRNGKVKIGLAALIVLIIGVAMVGALSNDNSQAGEVVSCANCITGTLDRTKYVYSNGRHTLYYVCSSCGFELEGATSRCSGTSVCVPYGDSSHRLKTTCSTCGHVSYGAVAKCTGGESHSSGGICTECGQQYLTHTSTLTSYTPIGNGAHKEVYTCSVSACNWTQEGATEGCSGETHDNGGTCEKCGQVYATHTETTTIVPYGDGVHRLKTVCSCGKTIKMGAVAECTGGENHNSGGICTECKQQYLTHTSTLTDYRPIGNGAHKEVYTCSVSGCNWTQEGATAGCSGETHENGGKCEKCGQAYATHAETTTIVPYGDGEHRIKTICSCGKTIEMGAVAKCTGGEGHNSGGICTECKQQYLTHTSTLTDYRPIGNGEHKEVYTCSVSECNWTQEGATAGCSGGTHENGGKCEKCGQVYQKHEISGTRIGYKSNGDGTTHSEEFMCSFPNCEKTFLGEAKECFGFEHKIVYHDVRTIAAVICIECGQDFDVHDMIQEYVSNSGGHTLSYTCMDCDDVSVPVGDEPEPCSGGTHDNGGTCEKCGQVYQNHEKIWDHQYEYLGNGKHRCKYTCSFPNCGVEEYQDFSCSGGEHPDGRCLVCKGLYQMHTTTVTFLPSKPNKHYVTYVCTVEGCSYENKKVEENCSGYSHDTGGRCISCGAMRETHNATTQIVGWDVTSSTHTPLYACSLGGCNRNFRGVTDRTYFNRIYGLSEWNTWY